MTSLTALNASLKHNDAFSLVYNPQTHDIHCNPLYRWQKANWNENASVLLRFLEKLPTPQTPFDASQSQILLSAKKVVKLIGDNQKDNPAIRKCENILMALRLAIPLEVLEKNPEFHKFAKQTYIYNYLSAYKETLSYDSLTKEILIKYKKQTVKWSTVPEHIKQFRVGSQDKPYEPWKYGPNGLRDKNFYEFTELKKVFKKDPKEWGNRYLVEMCTTCIDKPRTSAGDHSWIRLYDGETGKVYCVGLYRPDKRYEKNGSVDCLRVKPGYLMIDYSEFWGAPIQGIKVKITKENFLEMKTLIEKDKKREITNKNSPEKLNDALTFQLTGQNCTAYVGKVAKVANINLPDRMPFLNIWFFSKFYSARLVKTLTIVKKVIPAWILTINVVALTVFSNFLGRWYGSTKVDAKLAAAANARPPFQRWKQLFDRNLADNRSPFVLGQITRKKIEGWREGETKKLQEKVKVASEVEVQDLLRQIDDLQYELPPEGYLS